MFRMGGYHPFLTVRTLVKSRRCKAVSSTLSAFDLQAQTTTSCSAIAFRGSACWQHVQPCRCGLPMSC